MRHIGLLVRVIAAILVGVRFMDAESPNYDDNLDGFGFNLAQVLDPGGKENLLLSPASIEFALGMVYAGATGQTASEMNQALGFGGSTQESALTALGDLHAALENPGKGVTLHLANAVWIDRSLQLNPAFESDLTKAFDASLRPENFHSPEMESRVNDWVRESTEGKIVRILAQPPPPPLFLANAIYFHADWDRPFDKRLTTEDHFYPISGESYLVPMMHIRGTFRYAKGPGYAVVALPYAGSRFAMYCLLPDASVHDVLETLRTAPWSQTADSLKPALGSVALPKFRLEYGATLTKPLQQLGFAVAFDPQKAEFGRMAQTSARLFISEVLHKAVLEVDEVGSTAAAVTGVSIRALAMRPTEESFNLVFDHPFLAAIVDTQSNVILFLAIVAAPRQ